MPADYFEIPDSEPSPMLDKPITDGRAWTRDTLDPQDCIVALGKAGLGEVSAMADAIAASPLPVILRHPDQFDLPALRAAMGKAKALLDGAPGVAVVDRLPMDEISKQTATAIAWALGHLVGRPVAQKWDGAMVYDVTDTGAKFSYGVRASTTNIELLFHTDNAFGAAPPDYVALLCHYPAVAGGVSRFCSLYSVHNRMLERHPDHLARLYQPLLWDRQAEHEDGAPKVARGPMFRWDGKRLTIRANTRLNAKGYQLSGEAMDAGTQAALDAVKHIMSQDDLWLELPIERGQIQYLNNAGVAHYRSEFTDHDDPALKRHLVRTWHRDRGQVSYDG